MTQHVYCILYQHFQESTDESSGKLHTVSVHVGGLSPPTVTKPPEHGSAAMRELQARSRPLLLSLR